MPLLKDVLKKYKGILVIEIKEQVNLDEIYDYIDKENTYFIGFDTTYILKLVKKYPDLKFGILNYVLNASIEYDLKSVCLLDSVMTDKLANYFTQKNTTIFVYEIYKNINY